MKRERQSFTLVEILVVIVIIGILSSFIFFTINDSVDKANIAKSKRAIVKKITKNIKAELEDKLNDYRKVNSTDGQSIISINYLMFIYTQSQVSNKYYYKYQSAYKIPNI